MGPIALKLLSFLFYIFNAGYFINIKGKGKLIILNVILLKINI